MATLEEQKRIDELSKDNAKEKLLYQAAACALINCSAEFAENDPRKALYQELEALGNSDSLQAYREQLAGSDYTKTNILPDMNGFIPVTYETVEKLFQYTDGDKRIDAITNTNNEYSITTRAGGVLQVGYGVVEGVSGIAMASTCETGIGCVASGALIVAAADNASTGLNIIIDGKTYSTQGAKGLANILNISESDAEILYGFASGALTTKAGQKIINTGVASSGKLSAKELETIKSEVDRVGKLTVDPHAGKVKLAEGSAATDLENLLGGKVERIKDNDSLADFVFTSGPNKGKTVDFMFTTANGTQKEIDGMNKFFNNNWSDNIDRLHEHLNKADIIPLDFRKLTLENQQRLENYINTLSKSEQSKIFILR